MFAKTKALYLGSLEVLLLEPKEVKYFRPRLKMNWPEYELHLVFSGLFLEVAELLKHFQGRLAFSAPESNSHN